MNFLGGGERHSRSECSRSPSSRSTDADIASPGDLALLANRPGDVRHFVHKFIGRTLGKIGSSVLGGLPIVGGLASGIFDQTLGRALGSTVPQTTGCPAGFLNVGGQCVPRAPIASVPLGPPVVRPAFTAPTVQNGFFPPADPDADTDPGRAGLCR